MAIDLTGGLPLAREYVLETCPADGIREAVNVWLEDSAGKFGMRIGVEAVAPKWDEHEIWLDVAFADGRVISGRRFGPVHNPIGPEGKPTILGAGPLAFRCVEPFTRWSVAFKGEAAQISANDLMTQNLPPDPPLQSIAFDIDMEMAAPPHAPGTLLPEARAMIQGGAEGAFMSPRYEQLFRAKGALSVGDDRYDVTAHGLRIRRQGPRKFEGFAGHCWQSALFPSGRGFGYCVYPDHPDGKPGYNEGFIFRDGKRTPARVVDIPWLRELKTGGEHAPCVLETTDGERVSIDGVSFVNTRSRGSPVLPPDFPIVQQAHARYVWDGEETCGMMERSSKPSEMKL